MMSAKLKIRSDQRYLGSHDGRLNDQPPSSPSLAISRYYALEGGPYDDSRWETRPEFPSVSELLQSSQIEIAANKPRGSWESTDEYLEAQYELLREDTVRPLREAIALVASNPAANETFFEGAAYIYDKVHVSEIILSSRGVHARVTFSLGRIGKKVLWSNSKRLTPGTLVVLSPTWDNFTDHVLIAVVEARPLGEMEDNPAKIDLTFVSDTLTPLDSAVEYLMVEGPGCYFEASRHVLLGLQHMTREPIPFPFDDHFVHCQTDIDPPAYITDDPLFMPMPAMIGAKQPFNILENWPPLEKSAFDDSQIEALNRILTKRLAIVQGPPGTGKTYVSVEAVKVMLQNCKPNDPPIIVACQTNHAVDQFLRHIAVFESQFARLGGRCKDRGVVKERTMYELRQQMSDQNTRPRNSGSARIKHLAKEINKLMRPLQSTQEPLDPHILEHYNILSSKQVSSLETAASKWVKDNERQDPFVLWMGKSLVAVPRQRTPPDCGFEYDAIDWELEQLHELEAENDAVDDDEFDYTLNATIIQLGDNFASAKGCGEADLMKIKSLLREQDLWKINPGHRGLIYKFLQAQVKTCIGKLVQPLIQDYIRATQRKRRLRMEEDQLILREQKLIGMTTTGLSKNRGLLASLQPKIVVIEEAAECLEPPITVACMPSVEHLVLVGDHKQLRPHCSSSAYEEAPFWFNLSLFERMVNNGVEYTMLQRQRRMISEIRQLLQPFYGDDIHDHPCMADKEIRPDIPGMGGMNSFFFTHEWTEQSDANRSILNRNEAAMVVGMTKYLLDNGLESSQITILTFYNGQRKQVLTQLQAEVPSERFKVVTVDSYQGEENHVILLSLVRSNTSRRIGFLEDDNRICVAMSRAQCGFYMFGNARCLYTSSKSSAWRQIIKSMTQRKVAGIQSLGTGLPLYCARHHERNLVAAPADWTSLQGGCHRPCQETLPCGHKCELKCHPFKHSKSPCQKCDTKSKKENAPPKTKGRKISDFADIVGELEATSLIDFDDASKASPVAEIHSLTSTAPTVNLLD